MIRVVFPSFLWSRRSRNRNRNRNRNSSKVGTGTVSKVGTGTVKNSYGSATLFISVVLMGWIWCSGHVIIPESLNVPPSLVAVMPHNPGTSFYIFYFKKIPSSET